MMNSLEGKRNYIIMLVTVATLSMIIVQTASAQVPEHCGYSQEHACAVPNEEDAQKILEVFPDAIVIVDEELYESIPEEDREDAEGIIEKGARGGNEDSGESGSSGSGGDILPGDKDNFQPIPPGQQNLPPAEQSGAGLNQACLDSGFSQEKCTNLLFSDDPGGYCSTLKLAGLDCPKIQDPAFTYGNPEEARRQSEQQIENTERGIQGFEETVPNNLGEGFADD
jgi:hypothetical protein